MALERQDGGAADSTPASAAIAVSARDFAARYAAVAVLGESAEGKTYRARDRARDGREVALQVLQARFSREPEIVQRFFQDVRVAQSLVSPHTVEILDVGAIEDGRLFLSTELVDGETLAKRLQREGTLRTQAALEILRQTLLALDVAHKKNVVHGRLATDSIWLEARVPKSAENPEGIAVRVLGFGLGMLLAPLEGAESNAAPANADSATNNAAVAPIAAVRRESTRADDLGAAIRLLETMLAPASLADRSVQTLIARARSKDPKLAFGGALEFAKAIEVTRAWRVATSLPTWAKAGLTLLGIAAIAEGFWALEQRAKNIDQVAKNQELADAAVKLDAKRLEEARVQEAFCSQKIEELDTQIQAREEQITGLTKQIDDLQKLAKAGANDGRVGDELTRLKKELDQSHDELNASRSQLDDARAEKERLASTLSQEQAKAREAEQRAAELVKSGTPEAKTARGFDRLLALIRSGEGARALATYQQLAGDGTFAPKDEHTNTFLKTLAESAAALQEFRNHPKDARPLRTARAKLDELSKLENGFAVEAGAWLAEHVDDNVDPDRERAAQDVEQELAREIADASRELEKVHAADWTRLQATSRAAPPTDVLQHVDKFSCDHLATWLEDVDQELGRTLVRDSELDVAKVCSSDLISRWERELGGKTSPLSPWLAARAWYCGNGAKQSAVDLELPVLDGDATSQDWRAVLALEEALAAPQSAMPLLRDTIAVWRDSDLAHKTCAWYVDEVVSADGIGEQRNWEIRRSVFTNDGTVPSSAQRVIFARHGALLTRAGKTILDLKAHGKSLSVANWNGAASAMPPNKSWFPAAEVIDAAKSELAKKPAPCLVVRDESVTRWISPRFGMVREEAAGVFRMELVYVGPKR